MPVEIRELKIHTTITHNSQQEAYSLSAEDMAHIVRQVRQQLLKDNIKSLQGSGRKHPYHR